NTSLTPAEARARLGLSPTDKVMLFFGNIAPYKGLDFLVNAFAAVAPQHPDYHLIIAGRRKVGDDHWHVVEEVLARSTVRQQIIERIEYIPDAETEIYFKAADVLLLPYTHIFQSGVLFLGYSFGLPALVSDVGSLRDEVVDGRTGSVFKPRDVADLGSAIVRYFESDLYRSLEWRRAEIRDYANERHSWSKVAKITREVYLGLLPPQGLSEG
ncbi:MAG TPA: glycosyltransferase, partial [Chthoniobacterales bacterium]